MVGNPPTYMTRDCINVLELFCGLVRLVGARGQDYKNEGKVNEVSILARRRSPPLPDVLFERPLSNCLSSSDFEDTNWIGRKSSPPRQKFLSIVPFGTIFCGTILLYSNIPSGIFEDCL